MTTADKQPVHLYLDRRLYLRLKEQAKAENRTIVATVTRALLAYLESPAPDGRF